MQIIYLDSFKKDLKKIKNKPTKKKIKSAILKIKKAPSLDKITNIKSIKGKKNAYRLRTGDYRIELARVAHRKDIYDLFP